MGWFSTLVGGLITGSQNKKNRAWNSAEAEKNREFQSEESEIARLFNSNEAALQREWSAAEAERARDWNEEMYAKYNSLSGKIAQAEQAGINPMLAITGNAVSPMAASSSAPSGVSASSGSPSGSAATSSFLDIVSSMLGMGKLKAEIENIEANTDETRSREEQTRKETSWIDSLSQAELDHLVASKDELESRLGVNSATANKLEAEFSKLVQETSRISQITDAEVRKTSAEATLAEWQSANKELLVSLDVGADVLSAVTQIATTYMEGKTKLILGGKK